MLTTLKNHKSIVILSATLFATTMLLFGAYSSNGINAQTLEKITISFDTLTFGPSTSNPLNQVYSLVNYQIKDLTLLGSVTWDFSGKTFLDNLSLQFALVGQDITDTLPPGFTPEITLWLFFAGGLTLFNIIPGMITGFGEEFGHRGFMFPLLYQVKPWIGFVIGGLIWFVWHLPLSLIMPQSSPVTPWETVLNLLVLGIGSLCTFAFLAYVYVKSRNVFVASFAHIVLNNSSASLSYLVTITDQLKANLGLSLTMVIVVLVVYLSQEWRVFKEYFSENNQEPSA